MSLFGYKEEKKKQLGCFFSRILKEIIFAVGIFRNYEQLIFNLISLRE
jgi:hypothetical protein